LVCLAYRKAAVRAAADDTSPETGTKEQPI
jgi:hypothetical protein